MSVTIRGFYPTMHVFEHPHFSDDYLLQLRVDDIFISRPLDRIRLIMFNELEFRYFVKTLVMSMVLEALDLWAFGPVTPSA
jgi:hypothetical protein